MTSRWAFLCILVAGSISGQSSGSSAPRTDLGLGTLGEADPDTIAFLRSRPTPPSCPAPRSVDGKPDLSGVYYGPRDERETPDLLPWAAALVKENIENLQKDSPVALTIALGDPGGFVFRSRGDGRYDDRFRRPKEDPKLTEMLLDLGAKPYTGPIRDRSGE
jgi:hypothetical protein